MEMDNHEPKLPDFVVPVVVGLITILIGMSVSKLISLVKESASNLPPSVIYITMWLLLTSIIFDGRVLFEVSAATAKNFKLPEIVTENVTLFAESIVLPLWIRSAFWAVASMKMYNMCRTVPTVILPSPMKGQNGPRVAPPSTTKGKQSASGVEQLTAIEKEYPLFCANWLVNNDTPNQQAKLPSSRQACSLGILHHIGDVDRVIGESLSAIDIRHTKWALDLKMGVDDESLIIPHYTPASFFKKLNKYGKIVAVKRNRGDIVYGRIESNEEGQPAVDWDTQYTKSWMVSNLVHPSIMKALASQRMSTLLNKKDINSLLDIGEVNKNPLIRDSLMGVLHEQFEYEFEGIMSPKMKMKKEKRSQIHTLLSPPKHVAIPTRLFYRVENGLRMRSASTPSSVHRRYSHARSVE